MPTLYNLHFEHSLALLCAAIGICLTAGLSVALLSTHLTLYRRDTGKAWRALALMLAAGLGVWTTHFVAMLAYRPDLVLRFDTGRTILSAIVGIALVGMPMVAAAIARSRRWRIALTGMAGAGITGMHAVGISALTDCIHVFSWATNLAGLVLGTSIMGAWQARDAWARSRMAGTWLFVAAVCATHFVALSGDTIYGTINENARDLLSPGLIAACAAFALSAVILAVLLTLERFRATREAEAQSLKAVIESMSDGLVFIDGEHRLRQYNHRFLELFDTSARDIRRDMDIGMFLDVIARNRGWTPAKRGTVGAAMTGWIEARGSFDRECEMEDGRLYMMRCRPAPKGVVLTFHDVTVERRARDDLTYQAFHDALTGVGNRRALQQDKHRRIADGAPFSLLLIDLDEFKRINDAFGHAVGDALLVHVTQALVRALPAPTFIARMGGDEIAVLSPMVGDDAVALAEGLIEQLKAPVMIEGHRIVPRCSIGIASFAAGLDAGELMKRADMALYEAKRQGRGRALCYVDGLIEQMVDRQQLVGDLHDAVAQGGFTLAFQPVRNLTAETTIGYEALIRWHHPTRGWVSPAVFVPIAEECGLIEPIGRWVIAEACRRMAEWPAHLHVAINVSAVQLKSDSLIHHLVQAIAINGIAPGRVEIEVTETALLDDAAAAAAMIARVRRLGVRVALDDFGTGHSSLAHLRDFDFDRIKIDRSFVVRAAEDPRCMAILRATVGIGHELGVSIVAEGVETPVQLELLRTIGCDCVQGYLIGRPDAVVAEVVPDRPLAANG